MSYSNSEYNLRSRLYKGIQTPKTTNKSVTGRFGSSSLLVPRIVKKKRRFAKSQKLPPIKFENGSIHMSMIGLDQSAIPRKKSETGASGFGSNFFREEGEGSVFGKRSYIKDKIMPMPSDDNIEEEINIEEEEEGEELNLDKKYLTPLDFAQLVRDDPEMRDEFCYLRKRSHPYDWEIVQFNKIEMKKGNEALIKSGLAKMNRKKKLTLKEYMTISARGIIHFIDEEAYYISLEEWEREFRLYKELKKIKFFKNYKKWKNFTSWRKLRRRTQFKKRKDYLEANMFLIDPKLSSPLLLIRNKCVQIKNEMNIMDMSLKESMDIEEFKSHENMHVVKQAKQIEGIVNEQIKELLETSCKESLNAFKEENRIRNKDNDDVDDDDQNPPLLVGDESNKEMPYTQEATIRTHYKRLKKFIRLVDYLVLDSKLSMINNSVMKVNSYLLGNREVMKFEIKNNGGFPTLINIRADFINEEIKYIPSAKEIKRIFDEVIVLGVNHVCDEHKMLLNDPEFTTYVNVEETIEDGEEYNVEIYNLATKHLDYIAYKSSILVILEEIFQFIYDKSDDLNELLEVCIRANRFSRKDLENKERSDIYAYIERFIEDDEIIKRLIEKIDIGIFNFNREELKEKLFDISLKSLELIEDNLPDILEKRCFIFTNKMVEFRDMLSKPTMEVSQFVEHLDNYSLIKDDYENLTTEITVLRGLRELFNNDLYRIKVPNSTSTALKNMNTSRDQVRKMLDEVEGRMSSEINRAKKELKSMVPALESELTLLQMEVKKMDLDNENHDPTNILDMIEPKLEKSRELVQTSKDYIFFQDKLQIPRSEIEKFAEFEVVVKCYHNFWKMKKEWKNKVENIKITPVKDIKGGEVTELIKNNMNNCNVLLKEIDGNRMFIRFKKKVEKFGEVVTVINSLQGKAMKEREWNKIYEILKKDPEIDFKPFVYKDEKFKVSDIMKMNMMKYHQEIQEISVRASKEEKLLQMLQEIGEFIEGKNSEIVTELYKDSKDTYILGNNDNLMKLLDDKIVTVTNILSSRYVHGIKDKVIEKKKILDYFHEFIQELGQCQRMWLYLEPIFNGEESNRELMKERKTFKKNVHMAFIKFMRECHDNFPSVRRRIKKKEKKLIEGFRDMNRELEQLEKNLINYLDSKRVHFPRFYFVSNDGLIEILSNGKSLEKLQTHLGKMFDSIHKLGLKDASVISIISPQGEELRFVPQMNVPDGVNEILKKLEETMIENVKRSIKEAYKDFKNYTDRRTEWLTRHPAQSILTVDSILWTIGTEMCFEFDDPWDELEQLFISHKKELNEVVEKVRGDLPKKQRKMFNSLITQDIRYKNIIMELYGQGVTTADDFEWQKQLKFYIKVSDVTCRQSNSTLEYGNEFLGVPSKLAITPLTDRCWLTITSALSVNLGCAPVGPAGTGKTESVKDLAKNLGNLCIVYNCSEQVTVQMMQGQFLGMIKTGGWLCLDEFNRIGVEVLSVIATQILTMRNALNEKAEQFFFDSVLVKNTEKFKYLGVFTTMNPSYTGRTQLPDNLKVLFRKVAMMVPDYSIIAEVLLSSEGFFKSKELAVKMTKLYKLASEQLSQQNHYDFGMRAVKSILSMAGNLKKQKPEEDEDVLLIQAMRDVNIPKFLDDDKRLFNAIVQDLFPGKVIEENLDEEIVDGLKHAIKNTGLREIPLFIKKCVELHNTMQIRFGTMLVGPPTNGKSAVIDTVKKAYIYLDSINGGRHNYYNSVDSVIINPKSVSMGELLGESDPLTGDFRNGLASQFFTEFTGREDREMKWLIFDGPVDSLWIENLNSVLDDTRTLCLSNGKRIKLKDDMRVLFEMEDLSHASLATISRVGMIYLDNKVIPPLKMAETVFDREFKSHDISDIHKIFFFDKLRVVFPKLVSNLRKNCIEPIHTKDNNLMTSLIRIFKSVYTEELDIEKLTEENEETILTKIFVYALTWSVCCTANSKTQYKLEQMAANMFQLADLPIGSFDDSFLDFSLMEPEWVKWEKMDLTFNYSRQMKWSELVVPTKNTMKYEYLLKKTIMNTYPIYITGVTGTGKTSIIKSILKKLQAEDVISPLIMTFSAKTSSSLVQTQITSKMSNLNRDIRMDNGKIQKVTCLIPKNPSHKLVIFVDDVNMPETEIYGAQPPIEILRQVVDSQGFYDRENLKWNQLEQTVVITASIHPGNGREPINDRFTSKFQIVNIPPSGNDVMLHIFGTILNNFLTDYEFQKDIVKMEEKLVMGTLALYKEMTEGMLPTPTKSHYTFNLRDVSNVFQGMILMRPEKFQTKEMVTKLWIHECERVFCDRLTNEKDRNTFYSYMQNIVKNHTPMSMTKEDLIDAKYIFADFMDEEEREFEFLYDFEKTKRQILVYMQRTPLKVELFSDFVHHLCRLNRILMQAKGNALVIGVGGSGKKSMVTIASEMAGSSTVMIEPGKSYGLREFRKEVFLKMLHPAGVLGKKITFLFTDTHVLEESFLEEVNNLINTGEMELEKDLQEKLMKDIEPEMIKAKSQLSEMEFYLRRVRSNLHIVLAMSPVGDALRTRLRNFPAFMNSCTIDWVDTWPEEALRSISVKTLKEDLESFGMSEDTFQKVIDMCVISHQGAFKLAEKLMTVYKRKIYITPKHFLDLILSLNSTLKEFKGSLEGNIRKLSSGLTKLAESGKDVANLEIKLKKMEPILKEKNKAQDILIQKLDKDKNDANKQKEQVEDEKSVVEEKAEEINDIKNEAQFQVDQAKPKLEEALKALSVLEKSRGDLAELRQGKMKPLIKDLFECVLIIFGLPGDEASIKSFIKDVNFLKKLKDKHPKNVPKTNVKKLKKKMKKCPDLNIKKLESVTKASISIFKWIKAVEDCSEIFEKVHKLEKQAKEIQVIYDEQMRALRAKEEELESVMAKVQKLEDEYEENKKEGERLSEEIKATSRQLDNAGKLTKGLANEQVRWKETVLELSKSRDQILGDSFLSAAVIAYHGPFSGKFRSDLIDSWIKELDERDIETTKNFAFENRAGDVSKISEWNIMGLPSNSVSVCNGILVEKAISYPYLIDPQLQANKWIKKLEEKNNIKIIKANDDKNLELTVENCIRLNMPCLIENCSENLPAFLDPILMKQYVSEGGVNSVKIGKGLVDIEDDFKIYFTTKIPNPNFLPELFIRVSVINFTVTQEGLEEQLLSVLISKIMPEIEEDRTRLILSIAEGEKILRQNEDKILELLSKSDDKILENTELIENLESSKKKSDEVKLSLAENESAQKSIKEARDRYKEIAKRGSIIYFVVCDLSEIDPMYQFSLEYFTKLFKNIIDQTEKVEEVQQQIELYVDNITEKIFLNICRGLFNDHKQIFAFMLTIKIEIGDMEIEQKEWNFFLKGVPIGVEVEVPRMPLTLTFDEDGWKAFNYFVDITDEAGKKFKDILLKDNGFVNGLKAWGDSLLPYEEILPKNFDEQFTAFQKLTLVKLFRPDSILTSMISYVRETLGSLFVSNEAAHLSEVYKDSDHLTPIIFVLSEGSDPLQNIQDFANLNHKKLLAIALGQGQGKVARSIILEARNHGHWVLLQNCHLSKTFMPELEAIIEKFESYELLEIEEEIEEETLPNKILNDETTGNKPEESKKPGDTEGTLKEETLKPYPNQGEKQEMNDVVEGLPADYSVEDNKTRSKLTAKNNFGKTKATISLLMKPEKELSQTVIHPNFRLFLTSTPCDYFPITILQNGVKLTNEPPKGIKANMLKAYSDFNPDLFEQVQGNEIKQEEWRKMIYCYSIFHSVVLERRKFGPLGWNILYDFNDSDLRTNIEVLRVLMNRFDDISWNAVKYLTHKINYGGRVTDEWDWRTLETILDVFIHEEAVEDNFTYTKAEEYFTPNLDTIDEYIELIKELPDLDPPVIFGMHQNAEISYQIKESKKVIEILLDLQPNDAGDGDGEKNSDEIVLEFIENLKEDFPKTILKEGEIKPLIHNFDDSLEVCLVQEIERFNLLITKIEQSLIDLGKAIKGEAIMTELLDSMYNSFLKNQVPILWENFAYPSLKLLINWYDDFKLRVEFFRKWYHFGKPSSFWLSAFYFPQGFLTSVLQNYSRKTEIAINRLDFSFTFRNVEISQLTSAPESGCYIHGLYMEGAMMEKSRMILIDNPPGIMNGIAPMIHFKPETDYTPNPDDYEMPLYKTVKREGELLPTGQSSNFVLAVHTPTRISPEHWILNGAAYICSLD